MPRQAAHLERFTVTDAAGTRPVQGVEGVHPAGYLRPPASGALVLSYVSQPVAHEMPLLDFVAYLEEEGIDPARSGLRPPQSGAHRVRETFARCAKAIVAVAGRLGPVAETPLGCELELVPELRGDTPAAIRLLLRGRPLAGAKVLLIPIGGDRPDLELRTDEDGRAALPAVGGAVVLHAVWGEPDGRASADAASTGAPTHADPSEAAQPQTAGSRHGEPGTGDWRSTWASLTLRLPLSAAGGP
jgi:hypothetical protein